MNTISVRRQLLLLAAVVCTAAAICPEATPGIKPWSTWSGKPTTSNATVTVPADAVLLLDEAPPLMKQLIILGQLVVDPTKSFEIKAYSILVSDSGHFWVGSAKCPIKGRIIFTLFGNRLSGVNPAFVGTKSIGVNNQGTLDMHGWKKSPSWTVLSETALAGAKTIKLSSDVNWLAGDEIIIAGTDFESGTNAPNTPQGPLWERRIVSSRPASNQVGFDVPLVYTHWATTWTSPDGTDTADMRAEVGVLSRNVLVRGDDSSLTSLWGAHIMMAGEGATGRFSHIEVTSAGQAGETGRYPIHFHLGKDQAESYVKSCTVHSSFQRCYTVHGTHSVLLSENVCFNTLGHGFFIEDGMEQHNIYYSNLAIGMRQHTLLYSDSQPTCFWISNPANHFYDNHASSCRHGFWYALPSHPTGKSSSQTTLWPRQMRMGDFKRNVVHSCGTGMLLDFGDFDVPRGGTTPYNPRNWDSHLPYLADKTGGPLRLGEQGSYTFGSIAPLVIDQAVLWKCGLGIWANGQRATHVVRTAFIDNIVASQFPGAENIVENSFYVGETDNVGFTDICTGCSSRMKNYEGRTRPSDYFRAIYAYNQYDSGGPNIVVSSRFYNYKDEITKTTKTVRKAGIFTTPSGPHCMPPTNRFLANTFINVDNTILHQTNPNNFNMRTSVIIDYDGTLTGKCGAAITSTAPHLHPSVCVRNDAMESWICPPGALTHRNIRHDDRRSPDAVFTGATYAEAVNRTAWTFTNLLTGVVGVTQAAIGKSGALYTGTKEYATNIITNVEYLVTTGDVETSSSSYEVTVKHMRKGEWIRFAMPYPVGTTFTFNGDIKPVSSLAALIAFKDSGWFYDKSTALLWAQFYQVADNFRYIENYPYAYSNQWMNIVAVCPNNKCNQKAPAKVAPNLKSYPVGVPLCEKNGAFINGKLVPSALPAVGKDRFDIFTDSAPTGWVSQCQGISSEQPGYQCDVSSESVYQGKTAIRCKTPGLRPMGYWIALPNGGINGQPLSLTPYTHLALTVRSALGPMFGDIWVTLRSTNDQSGRSVLLTSPAHSGAGPVQDKWATYLINIDEFLLPQRTFWRITFWIDIPNPTLFYIDNLMFVKMTVTVSGKDARYPPTFTVPDRQIDLDAVLKARLSEYGTYPPSPADPPMLGEGGSLDDSEAPTTDDLPILDSPSNSTSDDTAPTDSLDTSKVLNTSAASNAFSPIAATALVACAFLAAMVF